MLPSNKLIAASLALALSPFASLAAAPAPSLEEIFTRPPVHTRPFVWWHWLGPNFSKEGITKDLEAMKASGIGGATIFNITSSVMESHAPTLNNPWPDQTYRSPKYWEAVKHACDEAKRLGLELGLHNTVGYSTTGGPWIDEPRGMQRIFTTELAVEGGATVSVDLPAPQPHADEGWGKTGRQISWFRDFAVLAVPAGKSPVPVKDIIDLTGKMDANGKLTWNAPAGSWILYRLAHGSTGRPPHPVPDDMLGKTLEADKMSLEQTNFHWDEVIEPMKKHLGAHLGTTMDHFLIDSYEAGGQNWTPKFREEFLRLKGYDPLPWLATFNGTVQSNGKATALRVINSDDQSARFEWDYKDVIATLFFENGWKPARDKILAVGATLQHEAYGGPFDTIAGSYLADLPMSEFWTGRVGSANPAIVGAGRAAGRTFIGAEAFTGRPEVSKWIETPAFLKASGDGQFASGVNRMILHHWVHQPFDDKYKPAFGMGWWGTHFTRHQTWFEPGKDFFRYLGRVQAMMQRGETPVHHVSVGTAAAGGDAIPLAVFLRDTRVVDGRIVLPSGRGYALLHFPHNGMMSPEAAARVDQLLSQGAAIVSPKPRRSPGLADYPAADKKVQQLAEKLWGDGKDEKRPVGRGTLFPRGDLGAALKSLGLREFHRVSAGNGSSIRIHPRGDGQARWFFIANTGGKPASFTVDLAAHSQQPELWDAETGSMAPAPIWRATADQRTEVDLQLGAAKSVFVVFRQPVKGDHLVKVDAPAGWSLAAGPDGARLESSAELSGTLHFASGKSTGFQLAPASDVPVTGPWSVALAPAIGEKFTARFDALQDLSTMDDPALKYFSGTAAYTTRIILPADALAGGNRWQLDLGKVHDMAAVTVNGRDLGVWWLPPFVRDITPALKAGENTIEIKVTNTWHNLLVGDEQHEADFEWGGDRGGNGRMMKSYPDWFLQNQPRPSRRKAFAIWYYHRKDTKLVPAGLVGPVLLRSVASKPVNP